MSPERLRDYFVEDIQNNTWTSKYRLVLDAKYDELRGGLVLMPSDETWTRDQAEKFTRLCLRLKVPAPVETVKMPI